VHFFRLLNPIVHWWYSNFIFISFKWRWWNHWSSSTITYNQPYYHVCCQIYANWLHLDYHHLHPYWMFNRFRDGQPKDLTKDWMLQLVQ
jgi:hypothetical protein